MSKIDQMLYYFSIVTMMFFLYTAIYFVEDQSFHTISRYAAIMGVGLIWAISISSLVYYKRVSTISRNTEQ